MSASYWRAENACLCHNLEVALRTLSPQLGHKSPPRRKMGQNQSPILWWMCSYVNMGLSLRSLCEDFSTYLILKKKKLIFFSFYRPKIILVQDTMFRALVLLKHKSKSPQFTCKPPTTDHQVPRKHIFQYWHPINSSNLSGICSSAQVRG